MAKPVLVYGTTNELPAYLVDWLTDRPENLNDVGVSEEIQAAAVALEPKNLRFVKNPSERVQLAPGGRLIDTIRLIESPCESAQLAALSPDPQHYGDVICAKLSRVFQLGWIRAPSEAAQLVAVAVDPVSLAFIESPSEAVCQATAMAAQLPRAGIIEAMQARARADGATVLQLKQAPELDMLAAVFTDPTTLVFLENPSEVMCQAAAKAAQLPREGIVEALQMRVIEKRRPRRMGNLADIPNPCPAVQLAVVTANTLNIRDIKNPTEAAQLVVVRHQPGYIRHIKTPAESTQLAAVSESPWVISHIDHPTEAVQLAAVTNSHLDYAHTAIQFINAPCEAAQLVAVKQDPRLLASIDNPTDAACQAAATAAHLPVAGVVEAMQLAVVATWVEHDKSPAKYNGIGAGVLTVIRNPLPATLAAFLSHFPEGVLHLENPADQLIIDAVRVNPKRILPGVKAPSESVQLAAVLRDPTCLALLEDPAIPVQRAAAAAANLPAEGIVDAMQMQALTRGWDPITEIKSPTEDTQLYVLGQRQYKQEVLVAMLERSSQTVQKAYAIATQALGLDPYTEGFADVLKETYGGIKRSEDHGAEPEATGP